MTKLSYQFHADAIIRNINIRVFLPSYIQDLFFGEGGKSLKGADNVKF